VRVLVVDDSAYTRFIISQHLNAADGLTVVGTARDGQEALELIPILQPDVVTLDVEMPRLAGLLTLQAIMTDFPRPVSMLSSLTADGTSETIRALTLGAVDFVAKPEARANVAAVMNDVVAKVRVAARARVRPPLMIKPAHAAAPRGDGARTGLRRPRSPDKVVVIGASTGGPRALYSVLADLPADLPAAVLLVQHMPVGFTRSLAERLNEVSPLHVREAAPGDVLSTGRVLLAPGGFHLSLDQKGRVELDQTPAVHGVRPAVDVTMTAVTQQYKDATVAVVLTGMGSDGTQGARLIRDAGGHVIAEAESSCVVWGMPRSVVEAGVADAVVPLPEVAAAIQRAVCP
jgi:two-component system chemotaxis response regulator CheB